jgi:hypothetical protein
LEHDVEAGACENLQSEAEFRRRLPAFQFGEVAYTDADDLGELTLGQPLVLAGRPDRLADFGDAVHPDCAFIWLNTHFPVRDKVTLNRQYTTTFFLYGKINTKGLRSRM